MTTVIKNVQNVTTIKLNGAMPVTPAQIEAYFSGLPEFDNDEAAGAVVGLSGWYLTSNTHDSLPGGVPKQVRYT